MGRLALTAMLLLALAPTVSRTLQASKLPGNGVMRLVQLCTATGMENRLLPGLPAAPSAEGGGHPGQPGPHQGGDACGYCSLTAPPPVALLLTFVPLMLLPVASAFRPRALSVRSLRNLRGLGAQAPPPAL